MFYGGKMKSMPPKLLSDNGEHTVIRPLAYCKESDIARYAEHKQYPIIPCNLCGSQENLQRKNIKLMLQDWHRRFPGRIESMFTAMQNITPSHMLDQALFNFKDLSEHDEATIQKDTAFDHERFGTSFTAQTTPSEVIEIT